MHHGKTESGHHDSAIEEEEPMGGQGGPQEPRRRSNSASYGQVASFQCNLCQISLNSQSQVAQVTETFSNFYIHSKYFWHSRLSGAGLYIIGIGFCTN